nr:MAG TPA: hypothetical protein [Crassvirales sp.]
MAEETQVSVERLIGITHGISHGIRGFESLHRPKSLAGF